MLATRGLISFVLAFALAFVMAAPAIAGPVYQVRDFRFLTCRVSTYLADERNEKLKNTLPYFRAEGKVQYDPIFFWDGWIEPPFHQVDVVIWEKFAARTTYAEQTELDDWLTILSDHNQDAETRAHAARRAELYGSSEAYEGLVKVAKDAGDDPLVRTDALRIVSRLFCKS